MKNSHLQKALQELKQAKNLAERITVTTSLINQAAYRTAKRLYGIQTPAAAEPSTTPIATNPDIMTSEPIYSDELETVKMPELDPLSKELIRLDDILKGLRHDYALAATEVEKNAIHFKILRIERQRNEYLKNNR